MSVTDFKALSRGKASDEGKQPQRKREDKVERTRLSPVFEQVHSGESCDGVDGSVEEERETHQYSRKAHRPLATEPWDFHEL